MKNDQIVRPMGVSEKKEDSVITPSEFMAMTTIKDSGEKRSFETGAVRDRAEGKGRCDLLPAAAWNILGAMWMEEKRPEMQDIETRGLRAKIGTIDEGKLTAAEFKADKIVTGTIDTAKIPLFKVGQKVKYKSICYGGYPIGHITGIVQVLDDAHGDSIGKRLYYVEKSDAEVTDPVWEEDLELVEE